MQLWIDAGWCWLGSQGLHTRTVELRRAVGFCNSGGNGCFSILANGVSSVHGEVTLSVEKAQFAAWETLGGVQALLS